MELSFLVDALKSLLINYTSNNSQIDESLNDLFSSLESKNLNNEIENYAEFILLASSLFELKAKRMLPQEEEIEWMDEVEVLKDKDLAFARLLQFKAFSEIGIALASKIKAKAEPSSSAALLFLSIPHRSVPFIIVLESGNDRLTFLNTLLIEPLAI